MKNAAEQIVSTFYNSVGWKRRDGITEDAIRFEDLRQNAQPYVRQCRLRLLKYIPAHGERILDMASGPIQYEEYLEYSKNFSKRYCVDLSSKALEDAKKRIGEHGVFLCGSWFDISLEENFFDCAISLHTIYHIDKDKQEEAVRRLIKVIKPGAPLVIVYRNPHTLLSRLTWPARFVKRFLQGRRSTVLYDYEYPITWWDRFEDECDIQIVPWRSFHSRDQKLLIPDNKLGKKLFDILFYLENKFPKFFARNFQFPMIILTKRIQSRPC